MLYLSVSSPPRPFVKLKENGRSNISRSSSSTSSFSSTAGESETLEEYDSVVGTQFCAAALGGVCFKSGGSLGGMPQPRAPV